MKYSISALILFLLCHQAYAQLPMSDDEIRKMIVQGELNEYDNGSCPAEFVQRQDSSESVSRQSNSTQGSSSQTDNRIGNQSGFAHGGAVNEAGELYYGAHQFRHSQQYGHRESDSRSGSVSESSSKTLNPAKCVCACPYSKDINGRTCGSNSAYIKLGAANVCYPEDIADWVVEEYRLQHEIPRK